MSRYSSSRRPELSSRSSLLSLPSVSSSFSSSEDSPPPLVSTSSMSELSSSSVSEHCSCSECRHDKKGRHRQVTCHHDNEKPVDHCKRRHAEAWHCDRTIRHHGNAKHCEDCNSHHVDSRHADDCICVHGVAEHRAHAVCHRNREIRCDHSAWCHDGGKHGDRHACVLDDAEHCRCYECQAQKCFCECKSCRERRARRRRLSRRENDVSGRVVVQFRSQWGDSRQIQIEPPTFEELRRYVRVRFRVRNPRLFHADEVGYVRPLETRRDFEHAVRITGRDRYLTILIGYERKRAPDYCKHCGRSDPPRYSTNDPLAPILEYNDLPPGLRSRAVLPLPFQTWEEGIAPELPNLRRPVVPKLQALL